MTILRRMQSSMLFAGKWLDLHSASVSLMLFPHHPMYPPPLPPQQTPFVSALFLRT